MAMLQKFIVSADFLLPAIEHATPLSRPEDTQGMVTFGHWSIECDPTPTCIVVGTLPPRKMRMKGKNAALQIEFTHRGGLDHGVTVLSHGGPIGVKEISLTPDQAQRVLHQLSSAPRFMMPIPISETELFYVPGLGFSDLMEHVRQTVPNYSNPSFFNPPAAPSR
jgi:hypothetical protein